MNRNDNHLLTQRELSDLLKVATRTLAHWRQAGSGPSYVRLSRGGKGIRYNKQDVDDWLQRNRF